jgi:integrase
LLNRCLVLTVNESREQTRAIHALQRSRETLEGLLAKERRDSLLSLHRNAQRLLQPLAVVNPYADQLSFRDDQTRSRRDHVKYLKDDGTLFLSPWGEAFQPNAMTTLVRHYVERSGVGKKGACHLFRHTMATLMLEGGADIRFIQAMLGHAELSTTEIYTQVSIRLLQSVHAATHPGRMPEAGRHALELDLTAEALLEALDREAEEEEEG